MIYQSLAATEPDCAFFSISRATDNVFFSNDFYGGAGTRQASRDWLDQNGWSDITYGGRTYTLSSTANDGLDGNLLFDGLHTNVTPATAFFAKLVGDAIEASVCPRRLQHRRRPEHSRCHRVSQRVGRRRRLGRHRRQRQDRHPRRARVPQCLERGLLSPRRPVLHRAVLGALCAQKCPRASVGRSGAGRPGARSRRETPPRQTPAGGAVVCF